MSLLDRVRKMQIQEEDAVIVPPDAVLETAQVSPLIPDVDLTKESSPEVALVEARVAELAAEEKAFPEDVPPPRKRGRPRKNPLPVVTVDGVPVQATHTVQTVPATTSEKAPSAPVTTGGFRLYVDCIPMHEKFTYLDEYVARKASDVSQALDVMDVRLVDFGKGTGSLAALAQVEPPEPGTYVAIGGDRLMACVVEALIPKAEWVVKGVR